MKTRSAKQDEPPEAAPMWMFFCFFFPTSSVFFRQVFTKVPLQHSLLTFSIEGNRSAGGLLTNDR